jgi:CDGSH-type Zn-finger protein
MTTLEIINALRSLQCRCGHSKQKGQPFCAQCHGRLSDTSRRAVYARFDEGFEAAYVAACAELDAPRANGATA